MDYYGGVANLPNIAVSVIVVLDDRVGSACQGGREWLVEKLDSNDDILIALLGIFVGNQLYDPQSRVNRIALSPSGNCWLFDELTGVV